MARPRPNLLNRKFGQLTVIASGTKRNGRPSPSAWVVRCACGKEKRVVGSHLVTGRIKSCGCIRHRPPSEVPPGYGFCWGKCRAIKPAALFYKSTHSKTGLNSQCIECYRRRLNSKRSQILEARRKWSRRLREEAIRRYGGECSCCGENQFEFLAIDHIHGGGARHRRRINTGNFGWWLRKNGYPRGFQVLCHNCNMARGLYGHCPHEHQVVLGR